MHFLFTYSIDRQESRVAIPLVFETRFVVAWQMVIEVRIFAVE